MRAVVLAAGQGLRLRPEGDRAKVLHPLLGLTFLDRVILTAKEAGVREFVLVTGHLGGDVEAYAGDGSRWGVQVVCVRNKAWEKGSGTSLLAARPHVEDAPFLVLMGDHILDPAVLRSLLAAHLDPPVVAIDPRVDAIADLDEAMKVRLDDDRVAALGRDLTHFDAVDSGIFLFDGSIFPLLEETTAAGEGELSDSVAVLADMAQLQAWRIPPTEWFDLDTPQMVGRAEDALLRNLAKKEDGPVARYLNRPISRRISRRVVNWPLTPNHWTILSFSVAVAGALFLAVGPFVGFVAGGLLAQLASILDGTDGEVARLRLTASRRGGWFDAVLDRYADLALLLGLAVGGWQATGDPLLWPALVLAVTGAMMVSYTSARYEGAGLGASPVGGLPAKRDSRILLLMVGAILVAPLATLVLLAILGHAEAVRRLVAWQRKERGNS
ncbi:MAG: NTP transferase domain-containing protein [Thermoplasmata archaeon]